MPIPPITLRFKKVADAASRLTGVRADGSFTTTRIGTATGFGPVHDLSHYVVESEFGFTNGFLGLLAQGWNVEDFDHEAAKQLPDEAFWAEIIAGELSRQAMMNQWQDAADFQWSVEVVFEGTGRRPAPPVTRKRLASMRAALEALRAQWDALPVNETLELRFPPDDSR